LQDQPSHWIHSSHDHVSGFQDSSATERGSSPPEDREPGSEWWSLHSRVSLLLRSRDALDWHQLVDQCTRRWQLCRLRPSSALLYRQRMGNGRQGHDATPHLQEEQARPGQLLLHLLPRRRLLSAHIHAPRSVPVGEPHLCVAEWCSPHSPRPRRIGVHHYIQWRIDLLATLQALVAGRRNPRHDWKAWIGYELITATGIGLALQIPMIANQALVPADDMPTATSLTLFFENCGTAFFVASGEAAFTNGLLTSLRSNLPQLNAREVLDAGATQIRILFSGNELDEVLKSYLHGCRTGHLLPVACGAIAAAISLSNAGPAAVRELRIRWKKIHER
jgi:hypothetical protein